MQMYIYIHFFLYIICIVCTVTSMFKIYIIKYREPLMVARGEWGEAKWVKENRKYRLPAME